MTKRVMAIKDFIEPSTGSQCYATQVLDVTDADAEALAKKGLAVETDADKTRDVGALAMAWAEKQKGR